MKVINNKRLGIYFFYDKQGIVDRFVPYFLDDLCKNLTKLIIICNGKLNDEGKVKNFIPSTEYEEILRGLTLFTLNSSFSKIINLTTSKEKINIYKKEDVE